MSAVILPAVTGTFGGLGGMALGALGSIGNGQSAESNAYNYGLGVNSGTSWNDSQSSSWGSNMSDAYGSAYGNSWGYGGGENWSEGTSWNNAENSSWGNGENRSWNAVYGSEASAKDVMRAAEANAMQDYFARQQMAYNSAEAAKVRDYEAYMSNTSYQRAVADLKAAGLNPILAALNMGASTPSVSAANAGLSSAYKANTYADQYGGSYGYNNSGSYGYSQGGSRNNSYGYSYNKSGSEYSSYNRSHSEGNQGSRGWSHGGSENKGYNMNYGQSSSKSTNNLMKAIEGIGNLLSGVTDAFKTWSGPAGFDGHGVPSNY